MPIISFTPNLQRHVKCPKSVVEGATVIEVLEAYFEEHASVRSYVLDDQGALRHHMMLFIDGEPLSDRRGLSDPMSAASELYVVQALSGG